MLLYGAAGYIDKLQNRSAPLDKYTVNTYNSISSASINHHISLPTSVMNGGDNPTTMSSLLQPMSLNSVPCWFTFGNNYDPTKEYEEFMECDNEIEGQDFMAAARTATPVYKVPTITTSQSGKTVRELEKQILLHNTHAHECRSKFMDISTVVFDIDFKFVSFSDFRYYGANIINVLKSLVKMINDMFVRSNIVNSAENLTHTIYRSEQKHTNEYILSLPLGEILKQLKIGLHHHVQLPIGSVLANFPAAQFSQVFNSIRSKYSDLGMWLTTEPFDDMYLHSHHFVRLPNMEKPNGGGRLVCVYRSDGLSVDSPTPLAGRLIHGMQYDADDKPVIWGVRIVEIKGIQSIDDKSILLEYQKQAVNNYVTSASAFTGGYLRKDLNSTCVLFMDSRNRKRDDKNTRLPITHTNNKTLLYQVINNIWMTTKDKVVSVWGKQNRTREECAMFKSYEVYHHIISDKFYLVLPHNIPRLKKFAAQQRYVKEAKLLSLPVCLHAKHSKKTRTRVRIIHAVGMINLGLQCECFKCPSCSFVSSTFLAFSPLAICPGMYNIFKAFIEGILNGKQRHEVSFVDYITYKVNRTLKNRKSICANIDIVDSFSPLSHLFAMVPTRLVCFQSRDKGRFTGIINVDKSLNYDIVKTKIFTSEAVIPMFRELKKCMIDNTRCATSDFNLLDDLQTTINRCGYNIPNLRDTHEWKRIDLEASDHEKNVEAFDDSDDELYMQLDLDNY